MASTLTAGCIPWVLGKNLRHGGSGSAGGNLAAAEAAAMRAACGLTKADSLREDAALKPLTNAQYGASVRSLLQLDGDPSEGLPADSRGDGFDTSSSGHAETTTLMQVYLNAGMKAASDYLSKSQGCAAQNFDPGCSGPLLTQLGEQAFRRPLLDGEKQALAQLPASLVAAGVAPRDALATGVASLLMSPQFLYRTRLGAAFGANAEQFALASTLSYTVWNSLPDAELLAMAKQGRLGDPGLVADQLMRLLADEKAKGFAVSFASQWLGLPALATSPAAAALPPGLKADYAGEATDFFNEFLQRNLNIKHLLDARFTYVTPLSAQQYGLPGVALAGRTRVEVGSDQRGGLLTQGAFLVQTSNPTQTSPVKRGKWILDNILCLPPPPQPPNIAPITATDASLPMRQRLAQHRAQPACAGCHQTMDPLGLAFESYDTSGRWRAQDHGQPIDTSGALPAGGAFTTTSQLLQLLQQDPAFPRCVVTKLATYSLGRPPTAKESCVIEKLAAKTQDEQYGLRSLLLDLNLTLLVY